MQLRLLRLFLGFAALAWGIAVVGVFASWPQAAEMLQGLGTKPIAYDPMLDYPFRVPIFHECQRCTACCRWPGQVRLTDAEITRLAAFKGSSEADFIQHFTRLRWDRGGLALQEQPDGACIFLEGEHCAVQPVKPQQCRDFPNLWNFPGFEQTCHALPRLVGEEEYQRRIAEIKSKGNDRADG